MAMVMRRPREADGDSTSASVAPEAGSSACVGVMVKGLMGAGISMKGPTVPFSKSKNACSTSPSRRGSSVVGIVAPSSILHQQEDEWQTGSGLSKDALEGLALQYALLMEVKLTSRLSMEASSKEDAIWCR